MRRLIYDMYYADEISVEIAERLLDKLEQVRNKRRRY
jgi:DNA-binding protein H-NS|tara:strand:- start:478 stop:588 length:111 start_codon:yes stop_codon:yes gene_type:complete